MNYLNLKKISFLTNYRSVNDLFFDYLLDYKRKIIFNSQLDHKMHLKVKQKPFYNISHQMLLFLQ
jgi:hypothetical protein